MLFEKLADGVMHHSKIIIIAWIVVLLASAPFLIKVGDSLQYDTTSMAGNDSEAVIGMGLISEYFYSSDATNMDSMVLLVVEFDDEEGMTDADNLGKTLKEKDASGKSYLTEYTYTAPDGTSQPKISDLIEYQIYGNADGGIAIYAMMYCDYMVENKLVQDDTGSLRSYMGSIEDGEDLECDILVTGSSAITYDIENGAAEDISHIDIFSIALILILVGLFFRSLISSTMPPITIGIALGVSFCALYFMGQVMDIFFITEMFMVVSMLGAGCDYCIFIISRYREERRKGGDHEHAMRESIIWAGESITTSGLAVTIGFGSMAICSFSLIGHMGIMLAIGIIIALMAALTLITSILNLMGERIFWPSKISSFQEVDGKVPGWYGKCARIGHNYFVSSAKFSIKHAKIIVIAAILFTVPTAYVYATAEDSYDMVGSMLIGDSAEGLSDIEEYTNGGMIMPDYVVMEISETFGTVNMVPQSELSEILQGLPIGVLYWNDAGQELMTQTDTLCKTITDNDDNVGSVQCIISWEKLCDAAVEVIGPQGASESNIDYAIRVYQQVLTQLPTLNGMVDDILSVLVIEIAKMDPEFTYKSTVANALFDYFNNYYLGAVGGVVNADGSEITLTYAKMTVVTKEQSMSDHSMDSLHAVDNEVKEYVASGNTLISDYWLTGSAAVMYDISEEVGSEFLTVELLAIALIFLLLFFVMKSYLTPLRSILTILMSVVWTVAITHLIFTNLLGDGVIWMIPVILLVICLGLGMDYDILLTTRIKENRMHRGMDNDQAITEAVVNSGSVITICGLIMGGAFGTLMMSQMLMLQEFGFALAFAIIIDALLVRTYVVPAVMHLLGDWCWKGPKFLHKND